MSAVNEFPARYAVRLEKNVLIPMRDGTLIAADLFVPDAPGRFPVVFEYLPYRKDDIMAYRQQRHHYFAERGFACAWVDIRGTGASGGVATDEYPVQEQDDACEIIAWLAAQPWSNGKVGMTGISWGGFNAIQVAMRRPPALKAIVPAYATDDRYTDDVHYYGGALRCIELIQYPLMMVAMNALPPHPEIVGERWADLWNEHLQAEPWMLRWLEEQCDGPYWRHGSLRPDYETIEAATLMICGWSDCYRNWPLRMFAGLRCPKRVIVGPWGHEWPNFSYPGPRIDYLAECVRWFRQYLGDSPGAPPAAPPVAIYLQHYHPPSPTLEEAPGAWMAAVDWPLPDAAMHTLYLGEGVLAGEPVGEEGRDSLDYQPAVGMCAPMDCFGGASAGLRPVDQRADEAYSLVYDTPLLEADLCLVGYPLIVLCVASTAEVAFFSVKLSDVAPDGQSTLVTRGLLNATRRDSLSQPDPLKPGHVYTLRIELDCCAWVFPSGHRLRLAIAGSDWPNVWPAPLEAVHTVYRGGAYPSRLELPIAPPAQLPAPVFAAPPKLVTTSPVESEGESVYQVIENVHERTVTLHSASRLYRYRMPHDDTMLINQETWDLTASRVNPARASARGVHVFTLHGIGGETHVAAMADVVSDRVAFHVQIDLEITVNGALHWQRHWTRSIARCLL